MIIDDEGHKESLSEVSPAALSSLPTRMDLANFSLIISCLSGESGDIVHSYLHGFFRSTSRQAAKAEEVEEVRGDEEEADEENPV